MQPLRFAVDTMLGRLATWLRLIGQDASYGPHLHGRVLVRHAREHGRTILTRDRRLLRVPDLPPTVFIPSEHFRDQLTQVIHRFHLHPFAAIFSRCCCCNEVVVPVRTDDVASHVPPYVRATQDHFMRCPRCHRIYWPATHNELVRAELRRMGFHPQDGSHP